MSWTRFRLLQRCPKTVASFALSVSMTRFHHMYTSVMSSSPKPRFIQRHHRPLFLFFFFFLFFKTKSAFVQSVRIADTMGRCFTLALELRRHEKQAQRLLPSPVSAASSGHGIASRRPLAPPPPQPLLQQRPQQPARATSLEAVFTSIKTYATDIMLATGDDLDFLSAAFADVCVSFFCWCCNLVYIYVCIC